MSLMPGCEKPFTWCCVLASCQMEKPRIFGQNDLSSTGLRGGCHWALWLLVRVTVIADCVQIKQ